MIEEPNRVAALEAKCDGLRDQIDALTRALEESVRLQAHYARLLNSYDGGARVAFESAAAWLARLEEPS